MRQDLCCKTYLSTFDVGIYNTNAENTDNFLARAERPIFFGLQITQQLKSQFFLNVF